MRNILLATFYFPPYNHPGVQRPLKFAKYLPEFGYRPIVLTCGNMPWNSFDAELFDAEVKGKIEVHATDAPRFAALGQRLLGPHLADKFVLRLETLLFEDRLDWARAAREEALRLVRSGNIELVCTTGPPQSVHFIGEYVKRKAGIPWVIDFRDSMVTYPAPANLPPAVRLFHQLRRKTVLARYERRWMRRADAVVVVTEPMAEDLKSAHPAAASRSSPKGFAPVHKISTITNGFDEDDFAGLTPHPGNPERFSLVYTGRFWGSQTPFDFLEGLKGALSRAPDLRDRLDVVFVGEYSAALMQAMTAGPLRGVVRLPGAAPHREAIAWQLGSDANLLIVSLPEDKGGRHILTGKLLEYLRAQRPILAVVPGGAARQFILANRLGCVVDPSDHAGIADAIIELCRKREAGALESMTPAPALLHQYSRSHLTEELAGVFDQCLGVTGGPRGRNPDEAGATLPAVSVLIASKGRRHLLVRCLDAIGRQTYPHSRIQVVVVEEGAEAAALAPIGGPEPIALDHVRIPPHDRGFGYPRNLAVARAQHELVAFLDDDCEAGEEWLVELVRVAEANDCEGVAGPVLARAPGVLGMCELAAGFPGGGVRYLHESRGRTRNTVHASTCNVLLKKTAITGAGGFADGMRFGGEDTLLVARICAGQPRLVYNPRAVIYHQPRDSWGRIAAWFVRRGRAHVDIARRERGLKALGRDLLRTSVFLRGAAAAVLSILARNAWVFAGLFLLYYLALAVKYRYLIAHFKGPRSAAALLLMPLVRLWMDVWFELGMALQLLTGRGVTS